MLRRKNHAGRKGLFLSAPEQTKTDPRGAARNKLYEKRGNKENWKTE